MHDILGHSLNTIAVQAEGARYAAHTDPDSTDRALADIGVLSRDAVDEVRGLIDGLRAVDETATRRPLPTLGDVVDLVATFHNAGADIRLRLDGNIDVVTGQVGLAAYRIIQEAVTNAVKHAGRAPIMVRATVTANLVDLLILNANPTSATSPAPATGVWRVAATLPW